MNAKPVALLAEDDFDRAAVFSVLEHAKPVALLAEGDAVPALHGQASRHRQTCRPPRGGRLQYGITGVRGQVAKPVALLAEGDVALAGREKLKITEAKPVALLAEGDLCKDLLCPAAGRPNLSPSSRRAWIGQTCRPPRGGRL